MIPWTLTRGWLVRLWHDVKLRKTQLQVRSLNVTWRCDLLCHRVIVFFWKCLKLLAEQLWQIWRRYAPLFFPYLRKKLRGRITTPPGRARVKISTECLKLLKERVLQIWWWYLHWFRRYRKKTRGELEIAPSGARVNIFRFLLLKKNWFWPKISVYENRCTRGGDSHKPLFLSKSAEHNVTLTSLTADLLWPGT